MLSDAQWVNENFFILVMMQETVSTYWPLVGTYVAHVNSASIIGVKRAHNLPTQVQ